MRDQGGFGLALGGGGPVGVAWEIGVLLALAEDAGFEPNRAKVIVGTSAGSIVGARLRRGRTPAELLEEQRTRTLPPPELTDPEAFGRFLSLMAEAELPPDERVRRVAEIAISAKTPPIEPFVEAVAAMVGGSDWPEGDLRISAVDCQSGDLQLWTMASGVGLDRAVTSSIAVPAVIGPVPVAGRLYMDGGVDSPNHADLLVGSGVPKAVFIGPLAGPSTVPALDALLQRERQHLEEAGIPLFQVVPGQDYAGIGMDPMNAGHAPAALEIGRADGRAAATALADFLSS